MELAEKPKNIICVTEMNKTTCKNTGADLPVELVFPHNQITSGDRHEQSETIHAGDRCGVIYERLCHPETLVPVQPLWQVSILDLHLSGHGRPSPFSISSKLNSVWRNASPPPPTVFHIPHSTVVCVIETTKGALLFGYETTKT
ncbi:hypothetical protein EIP73_11780 [Xylella fastidiosa subsp. pauca]|uniref:hypothetical protein n=1 Tax=Xylella fastidiosa TaxID=2371 RepID=UPI0011207339|nr:hypothetical protein [Xylella fastidiosa]TNW23440.1 hypothetical protein EIP73_11780 [Xylella fastidiosa subsp. pauca]